ncbi:hypothetical protein [Peribacillus simplex]|uniref:hypothetical protein n=1 Tax=Peribacillus simplex TaxID=1478 RepID=UPI003D2D98DA
MTVPFSNEEKDHAKLDLSNYRNIPGGFRNPLPFHQASSPQAPSGVSASQLFGRSVQISSIQ